MQEKRTRQDYLSDTLDRTDTLKVCKESTVPHLVPGLAVKGSYQLQLVHVTLLISDLSAGLLQQLQHLTNVRPPGRGIVESRPCRGPASRGGWSAVAPSLARAAASPARNTLPGTGRCAGGGGCSSVGTPPRTEPWPSGSHPPGSECGLGRCRGSSWRRRRFLVSPPSPRCRRRPRRFWCQ